MRVKIDNFGKTPYFGRFVGLLAPEHIEDSPSVVVATDNFGLYVQVVHPSRVTFVTPEQEAEYQS